MKYLRSINSYAGHARYLAELSDRGWIVKPTEPRTPYFYSLTLGVYSHPKDGAVIILETRHKHYEVWRLGSETVFATDGEAMAAVDQPLDPPGFALRVRQLESEGLTTSDAQGVAMVEFSRKGGA